MNKYLPFIIIILTIGISACKKEAGIGGTSSIRGKVYTYDYNDNYTFKTTDYYAPEEDVYIIYGDDITYGERIKTNYDGSYEFKYLREGKYKVYSYSKDSTGAYNLKANPKAAKIPIIKEVEISSKRQTVSVSNIEIIN